MSRTFVGVRNFNTSCTYGPCRCRLTGSRVQTIVIIYHMRFKCTVVAFLIDVTFI